MWWDRSYVIPATLFLLLAWIISSPFVAGVLWRGAMAAILFWLGVIDHDMVERIALDWHW